MAQEDSVWIMNGYCKIKNPLKTHNNFFEYAGPVEGYDFGPQTNNYTAIADVLQSHGYKLNEIYVGKWMPKPTSKRCTFVVNSDWDKFMWHKKESNGVSSGGNYIHIGKNKYNTTDFLAMTPDEQKVLFA